ncbi:ABC transporter permease [Sporolactobacillus shoreicorticis]|uniref:ABC transporter permease n=1 Tax=Sporolactobacillus shoreicorticis TaxID=1923877 RepID=A0ABW5S6B6_9BACL|nr:ABC transporter permease [Sporolactobacillus shoreicorticis]MCO7126239.1 ABC transporter permease [Sporolactobacillus shoreicorticis]
MTFFKLARRNMTRNFFHYFLYFGSMIFSVLIFFTFVSIQYNDKTQAAVSDYVKISTVFQLASIVLFIFVALFIGYSNSFFIRSRKREIGLYTLMGLQKKQIARMFFCENLFLGLLSLVVGIFIGMLLSKFFIMVLMKLLDSAVTVPFSISLLAVLETVIVFLVIIAIASLYGYRLIYHIQLVALFHDEKKKERIPKVPVIQAAASLLFIGVGYWVVLLGPNSVIWKNLGFSKGAFLILLCVIIGTILMIRFLTAFFINNMKKRKRIYYKGTNIIGISQLSYRIRANARILIVIAIMSSVTLVSVGASYSFYYMVGEWAKNSFPHTYEYLIPAEYQKSAESLLRDTLRSEGKRHKITSRASVPALQLEVELLELDGGAAEFYVISNSSYNELAARYEKNDRIQLNENEAIMLAKFYKKEFNRSYMGHNGKLASIESYGKRGKGTTVHYIGYKRVNFSCSDTVVVSDTLFKKLSKTSNPLMLEQIDVSDQEHLGKSDDQFKNAMTHLEKNIKGKNGYYDAGVFSFYGIYHDLVVAYGLMMFLGAFLGLVFLFATGSIIYFKQLNGAAQEKTQYTILRKIGLTNMEIRGTIAKQIGFIFALPFVVGVAHSSVALLALSRMIESNLIVPVVICMGIYAFIYFIYYLYTVRAYSKMVES